MQKPVKVFQTGTMQCVIHEVIVGYIIAPKMKRQLKRYRIELVTFRSNENGVYPDMLLDVEDVRRATTLLERAETWVKMKALE